MQFVQYAFLVLERYQFGRLEEFNNERASVLGSVRATTQHVRLEFSKLAEKNESLAVNDLLAELLS